MTLPRPLETSVAALCAVLFGLVLYQNWAAMPAFDPPPMTLTPRPVHEASAYFAPPSEAAFDIIDQHPIFSATRKPVEVPSNASSAAAVVIAPPNATLVGIIADDQTKLALVKSPGLPFSTSLGIGAMLDGWQVTEITNDHVTLRTGGRQYVLTLYGTSDATQMQGPMPQQTSNGPVSHPVQNSTNLLPGGSGPIQNQNN